MWAQPWAWLGLAGLTVPIAIHLLARRQTIRVAFPSLRFIDPSELNAITRHRLTDLPLLLVRLLMVAAAVAAIAGPRFGAGAAASDARVVRARVIDTTASASTGAAAAAPADEKGIEIRTESLGAGLDAAAAWAVRQSSMREIVVVSDFQRGSIDEADVRRVPDGVGLRFERVASRPAPMPAGFARDGDRARMVWPAASATSTPGVTVLAGPDQAAADAMLEAALSVVPVTGHVDGRSITVVFPRAAEREALLRSLRPIDQPWMFTVSAPLLIDGHAHVRTGSSASGLVVILDAEPSSLEAATAVASLAGALDDVTPAGESETRTLSDDQLRRWERAPEPVAVPRAGEPQGRWLWLAVIVLLAVETGMRRRAA